MIMHPEKAGVAIASLTSKGLPKNGFLDQQESEDEEASVEERSANARLIAAVPDLFEAAVALIAHYKTDTMDINEWPEPMRKLAMIVAKAGVMG